MVGRWKSGNREREVVSCGCDFFFFSKLLQKSIVIVIRKGAPTQVIGAASFVSGKVDMVVAREQGYMALALAGRGGRNWQRNYVSTKLKKKVVAYLRP
jgi:hypothetical protein